ncbi:hypothetical protein [Streptomyces acidiscabies]|uniref:hypothetical protein n=1 Tax=Streptomyces acidiscabies TaxID=42234 RepID=UPI00073EDE9E|nr:hypothetical protein [Streptomyces acidiscabies]GAQ54699.1 hypothetical protein a10_04514 [Streptomyces acidiscabies]
MVKSRVLAALCGSALLAGLVATTPAGAAPVVNVCGGAVADYTGVSGLDIAFTGSATHNGIDRPLTITPQLLGSNLVKVEIAGGAGDSRFALGNLEIRSNASGRGKILFPSYAGHGWSTDLSCTGTRVTRIIGKIEVSDQRDPIDFTVTR